MHEPSLSKQVITSGKGSIHLSASLQEEYSAGVEGTISKYGIEEFSIEYPQVVVALKDLFKDSYSEKWAESINFRIFRKFLYKYTKLWGDLLTVLRELKVNFYEVNSFLPNILSFLETSDKHSLLDIIKLMPVLGEMNTSRFFQHRYNASHEMGRMRGFGGETDPEEEGPINRGTDGHYLLDILSEFPNELDQLIKQDSNAYKLLGQYGKEILEFLRNHSEIWSDILKLEVQTGYHDTIISSLEDIGRFLSSKESERWREFIESDTPYGEVVSAISYLLLFPESSHLVDTLHEKLVGHYVGFLQEGLDLKLVIELYDSHREIWDSMIHYAEQSGVTVAKYIGNNAEKIIHYAQTFNWDNIKEFIEANIKQGPKILETLDMIQEITDDCSDDEYGNFYGILYAGQIFDSDFFIRDNLQKLIAARKAYPDLFSLVARYIELFWGDFSGSDYMKFFVNVANYCEIYGAYPEKIQSLKNELERKKHYSEFVNFVQLSVSTYISFGEQPDISLTEVDTIIDGFVSLRVPELSYNLLKYSRTYPQELQKIFALVRDGKLDPQYIFHIHSMSGGEGWISFIIKRISSLPDDIFHDLIAQIPRIGRHLISYIDSFLNVQNFHLLVRGLGKTLGSLIIIGSTRLEYLLQTEIKDERISEGLIIGLGHFLGKYKDSWETLLKYANKENLSLTELLMRQPDIDKLHSIITFEKSLPSSSQSLRIPKITPYKRTGYRRWDQTNSYGNYSGYTFDNSRIPEGVTGNSETLEGILHDPSLSRRERLTRFKMAYRDIYTLLARITTEMKEYISGSFDKYKSEQEALEEMFLEFGNSLNLLPSAMLSTLIGGLQFYIKKGLVIRKIINDPKYKNNPAMLLCDARGVDIRMLKGEVSVETDGANLVFYISNEHDYYLFYARGDSQEAYLNMIKSPSGGFSTSHSHIPQLQKTITCVNGVKGSDPCKENTKVHESRHALNSLIMPDYGTGDHLTRAKDEILAYMTDGRVWEMDRILSKTGDGALYDYYDDHKVEMGGNYRRFRTMYESELSKAIQIARRFYMENIPNYINLLALVPIRQWGQLYSVYFD